MAKALVAVALWLFVSSSVLAAAPQKKQPTWEECYAMSRQRGFDHDIEEWLQSIKDCQEGKIPL